MSKCYTVEISNDYICPKCSVSIKNPFIKNDERFSSEDLEEFNAKKYLARNCPSCGNEVVMFLGGPTITGFPDGHEAEKAWRVNGSRRYVKNKFVNRSCRYREWVEVRSRWHQGLSTNQIRVETGIPLERVKKLCQGFLKNS